ncbi:peptidase S10 [Candidatus Fermentibacteria bacterium]|nr:peptidase S10 [Candidatus Fermentibacteria bacterium]
MERREATVSEEKQEEKTVETRPKKRRLLGLEPVETRHELDLPGRRLAYTARTGVLPLRDEFDELEAEVFFTSYELDGVMDKSLRPLTFLFNGGPGSSSIWLHMGAAGPYRVRMHDRGWMTQPPFALEPNEQTWLEFTDMVFVDPVGTGYSRAVKEDLDKKYWSFKGDIESVGEFIRLYLGRCGRWESPLYLAGESYGTTRAAGLAGHLVDRGIAFNGLVLISTALDIRPIDFVTGDDLPFQLFVPTYAATAWYHKRLEPALQALSLPELNARVMEWSEQEFGVALAQGDRLPAERKRELAEQLARFTGLDSGYVLGTDLRIRIDRFCKELLREERRSVGRLDSRFRGIEALAVTEYPEFDPAMNAILPPYVSVFNAYLRNRLGIQTDIPYEPISEKIGEKWEWEKGKLPTTGETLRGAMAKNPFMKVLVAQGYYDLATPYYATEYMITHMNVDPSLKANIRMRTYEAGHMFYLDTASLKAFRADTEAFYTDGGGEPVREGG